MSELCLNSGYPFLRIPKPILFCLNKPYDLLGYSYKKSPSSVRLLDIDHKILKINKEENNNEKN